MALRCKPDSRGVSDAVSPAKYRPVGPVAREAEYRTNGWQTFDEVAPPHRPNQPEIDRMRTTWPG
jgi:hypothetical protein